METKELMVLHVKASTVLYNGASFGSEHLLDNKQLKKKRQVTSD